MSTGDIQFYTESSFGNPGTVRYTVQASPNGPNQINAGEPVIASTAVTATIVGFMPTSKPLLGTDFVVGVSQSQSTDTTALDGVVDVYSNIFNEETSFLISPKTAATWNTQTKYNALVGARVTLDRTSGAYTINATDAAGNGCVILPLEIAKYPGKVRFAFRKGASVYFGVQASSMINA